jgi:uncharacterized protein (TIGR02001 family)
MKSKDAAPAAEAANSANGERRFAFSANLALVSDYRIGGVSTSGEAAALQGGFDVDEASGWSAGLWASTIEEFAGSHFEVDLYAAKSFDLGATEVSLGATAIFLPGGENIVVGLADASVSRPIGPVDATLAVRYAWPQAELGDDDDLYVSANGESPIGRLAGVPLTLGASIGVEHGAFAIEDGKLDWSISMTASVRGVDFGIAYVDTDLRGAPGDPACVFSIARTF